MFTLHNGDCLTVLPSIPSGSVNLAILDLPYNISKAHWDKWKKEEDYIAWVSNILLEVQRTLADNGSLYFFHNDMEQVAVIMEWIRKNTKFIFKQFIVWNKRFDGAKNKGFLDGFVEVGGLRNYQQMAEYILYYTFQDETGLNQIQPACFTPYANYMTEQKKLLGWSVNQFNEFLGYKSIASHWFWQNDIQGQQPQPRFIAEKDYTKLQSTGYFQKEYEALRLEYEALRLEYEALRYTFNNQKSHHSVWNYEIAKANGHATPKPIDLITNIIMHSSKEGDLILDPTIGSGTTIEAAERTGRNSIGIEKDEGIFQSAVLRLKSFTPSNNRVQRTGGESGQQNLFSAGEVLPAKVTRQTTRR
jgi:site-specific DNA-methyltransferase (adenine-specific)